MKKIGYAQILPEFGDLEGNLEKIAAMVREHAEADLLVFPELATSGYEFVDEDEVFELAEPFEAGPTSQLLAELAAEMSTTVIVGYPELDVETGLCYNSCQMATPEGKLKNYRKIHLFDREKILFTPGDKAPEVYETPTGRVGMMICFDWLFPETSRVMALKGVQIIAHPSNLVLQFCQKAMYARSVENGVFTITANRIGTEERAGRSLTYTGASQVLSQKGDTLVFGPDEEEHVGLAEVNPSDADEKMITERNHRLGDRRIQLYEGLLTPEK